VKAKFLTLKKNKMNRSKLIEEIKEYIGEPHESVSDYMNDSDENELRFFLWRLKNNWTWFDGRERFINAKKHAIIPRRILLAMYEAESIKQSLEKP
jgi:hypothetical protein